MINFFQIKMRKILIALLVQIILGSAFEPNFDDCP